jgi:hypothetical protein
MSCNTYIDSAKAAITENARAFSALFFQGSISTPPNLLAVLLLFSSFALAQSGSISLTNSTMQTGRLRQTATLLNSGDILVLGGAGADAQVEAFTLSSGSFQVVGSMNIGRTNHTATLLPNGQVLITGGTDANGATLGSAELYDLSTGTSTLVPTSLQSARSNHRATLLRDGRVLITGGLDSTGFPTSIAEVYDPNTRIFSLTGTMQHSRAQHTATLLNDNRVLITGGGNYSAHIVCSTLQGVRCSTEPNTVWIDGESSAELYDPATGVFTLSGSMQIGRWDHSATLLPTGQVLILAGGRAGK